MLKFISFVQFPSSMPPIIATGDLENVASEMFQTIGYLAYELSTRQTYFKKRPLIAIVADEASGKNFWKFFDLKYHEKGIEIDSSDTFKVPDNTSLVGYLYGVFREFGLLSVFSNELAAQQILPVGSFRSGQIKYELRPTFRDNYPTLYVSSGAGSIEDLRLLIRYEKEVRQLGGRKRPEFLNCR